MKLQNYEMIKRQNFEITKLQNYKMKFERIIISKNYYDNEFQWIFLLRWLPSLHFLFCEITHKCNFLNTPAISIELK